MDAFQEQAVVVIEKARRASDAALSTASIKAIELRDQALIQAGVKPEDLKKLDGVQMVCAVVAFFVNLCLIGSIMSYSWMKATALSAGQPFTAYVALTSVQFGTPLAPSSDNKYFCTDSGHCDLGELCAAPDQAAPFPNGLPKNTPAEAWCVAASAGAATQSLVLCCILAGLAAMMATFLYAAKDMPTITPIYLKYQDLLKLGDRMQKLCIVGLWAVLWAFMFLAMLVYALMIPDSLGWGLVDLEASVRAHAAPPLLCPRTMHSAGLTRPACPPTPSLSCGSCSLVCCASPSSLSPSSAPCWPPTCSRCGRART